MPAPPADDAESPAGGLALTMGFQGPCRPARVVRIRPDTTDWGSVDNTKDISSAGIHAGAALGVLPALADIVAGGRSTDVKSGLRNGAAGGTSRPSRHPQ